MALEKADSVTAEAQFLQSLAVADTLPEPYLSLAFLYNRWGQRDSALALYDRALSRIPDHPDLLFGKGATLEQMGKFDASVEIFEHLIALHPDHAPALNYLGYMWADKDVRLKEALGADRARRGASARQRGVSRLARLGAVPPGQAFGSRAILRRALELINTDAVVFEHYGDVLADLGRLEEAREHWQRALSLDPDNTSLQDKLNR